MYGAFVLTTLPAIEQLIPHRPPMRLLDEVKGFDASASTIVCGATIRDSPLCRDGVVAAVVLLEHMAQAAAACTGLLDADAGAGARGYLVGVPSLEIGELPVQVGDQVHVRATRTTSAKATASFECEVTRGASVLASARLLVVREGTQ